jgi:flavin-dependent dehydrogenase
MEKPMHMIAPKDSSMIFDALVIGAGPAGATSALLLAQAGWSVAIVEKKLFPRRKVCGEFISATSLPLLQKLGILDFYVAEAGPEARQVGLFAGDTILASAMPLANHTLGQWGRALGREHLDTILLNRAVEAGAKLWQPCEVKSWQRKASLFVTTISCEHNIEQITSRVLIMANGSWERGPKDSKAILHQPSDLLAFKAHFTQSDLGVDVMPLLAFRGGYGGLVHSDKGRVTLSCCIRRDRLQKLRQRYLGMSAGEAVLRHISSECLGVRQVLRAAQREGRWLSAGPIRPGIRRQYAEGVFYVGNVAGEAHPIVAEGISMAMQSGWLLSQVLLKAKDKMMVNKNLAEIGRNYTNQWRGNFAKRIRAAEVFAYVAMRPWMVAILLPLLKWFPAILTYGATLSGKINQVVPLTFSAKLTAIEKENAI